MALEKYDQALFRIEDETTSGRLNWTLAGPGSYRDLVVNPERVLRCLTAELELAGKRFPLLFVEKKDPRHGEFGDMYEAVVHELLVLDAAGRLIVPLYDGVVDRNDLARLGDLIADSSGAAREFFGSLLGTEAA